MSKKRVKSFEKRAITLIELFIALFLISIIGSIFIFKSSFAIKKNNFNKEVEKAYFYMQYCQKMALIHQADVYLQLKKNNEKIRCAIGSDETQGLFENQRKEINYLKDLQYSFRGKINLPLIICFSSTGGVFPEGEITFFNKNYQKKFDLQKLNLEQTFD